MGILHRWIFLFVVIWILKFHIYKINLFHFKTTIRSIPVSRNPTSAPRRLKVATTVVPKLPSAQPLIRTSVRDVVSNEQATDGKKNGKEAVIRFVSTVSPRPFNKKVFNWNHINTKISWKSNSTKIPEMMKVLFVEIIFYYRRIERQLSSWK